MTPELSRPVKAAEIGSVPRPIAVEATESERGALAERFGLLALESLTADLAVHREAAGVRVTGRVRGVATQSCVISGEAVPATVDQPVDLLFAPETLPDSADAEIELSAADCDVLPFDGQSVDLGEAAAQSFGLALDAFPQASGAAVEEARRHLMSEEDAVAARSPFAALKKP